MAETDMQTDEDDRLLLRRMAAGDRAALEILYRSYHGRLGRFLSRLTRRADVIEEAINDTFWIAWQKCANFHGNSRVSTWIMGITYRCGLKVLRQHGDEAIEDDGATEERALVQIPDEHRELRDWLNKGLKRLTADQRAVVELVYDLGHSLEEVAAIMQCPVGTIKARLFHARVKLRNVLPDMAGEAPMRQEKENMP